MNKCASFWFPTKSVRFSLLVNDWPLIILINHFDIQWQFWQSALDLSYICQRFLSFVWLFRQSENKNSYYNVIIRVRVVLKRSIAGDWRFDNLTNGHLLRGVCPPARGVCPMAFVDCRLHNWLVCSRLRIRQRVRWRNKDDLTSRSFLVHICTYMRSHFI